MNNIDFNLIKSDKNNIIKNVEFGKYYEKLFLIDLNKKYINMKQPIYEFQYYDFYNDDYIVELKTRCYYINNFKNKCNNVWLNKSKIIKYNNDKLNQNKKFLFIAKFLDVVLEIEYDKIKFNKYNEILYNNEWMVEVLINDFKPF